MYIILYFRRVLLSLVFLIAALSQLTAQRGDSSIVQFSGQIVVEEKRGETEYLFPLPFANIYIENAMNRGTYSNSDGFFSLVGRKGETVVFSALGYKEARFKIPDTLQTDRYSIIQLMSEDTLVLPTTVIYPWPSRDHLKIEFLAMDVSSELQARAMENLASDALQRLREDTPYDGGEGTSYYLREQAKSYYTAGQYKQMNILSPIAWSKFFKAWKNGDFKKKKKE